MPESTEEAQVHPWSWPRVWWHDEKFWRETATRTVSGLLVVLIVYLFALGTGFVSSEQGYPVLVIFVALSSGILAVPIGSSMGRLFTRKLDDSDNLKYFFIGITIKAEIILGLIWGFSVIVVPKVQEFFGNLAGLPR